MIIIITYIFKCQIPIAVAHFYKYLKEEQMSWMLSHNDQVRRIIFTREK